MAFFNGRSLFLLFNGPRFVFPDECPEPSEEFFGFGSGEPAQLEGLLIAFAGHQSRNLEVRHEGDRDAPDRAGFRTSLPGCGTTVTDRDARPVPVEQREFLLLLGEGELTGRRVFAYGPVDRFDRHADLEERVPPLGRVIFGVFNRVAQRNGDNPPTGFGLRSPSGTDRRSPVQHSDRRVVLRDLHLHIPELGSLVGPVL